MAVGQIIAEVHRKAIDGTYDTFHIGPEQRYSQALSTSNNNNLEEQLLMGVDRIIRTWHDDITDIDRKNIEFRRENDTNNYYKLEVYQYGNGSSGDIFIRDDNLYFTSNMSVNGTTLSQDSYNTNLTCQDEELIIAPVATIERDELKYIQEDGSIIDVSSKTIIQSYESNAIVTKEVITNYLNN